MARTAAVNQGVVLPPPGEKYDAANERETRRLIEEAMRRLSQWGTVTDVPSNVVQLSALAGSADKVPYFTGVSAMALAALTPYARTLIACADAATARTILGLQPLAVLALSGTSTQLLRGNGTWGTGTEDSLTLADVTTLNVSTAKHGLVPKAPNDLAKFLRGDGLWANVGGGTPPAFPTISNWEFGIDAALSVTTTTGGLATQITDISGNARHATPPVTGGRPRYLKGGFNYSYPCWVFDGTATQHMVCTLPNLAAPVTIVMVLQDLSTGQGDGNIYRDQSFRAVGYLQGNSTWSIFGSSTGFATSALWDQNKQAVPQSMTGAPCIRIDVYNNASSLICNNAVEVTGSATCSGTIFGGVLNIGNGGTSVTSAAKFLLRGFHIYSKALSLAERDLLRNYYADSLVAGIAL